MYRINLTILNLISSISYSLGKINASYLDGFSEVTKKENRIASIHATLSVKGNKSSNSNVKSLVEKKRIIDLESDVHEVLNAIEAYKNLTLYNPYSTSSLLKAHQSMMKALSEKAGKFTDENSSTEKMRVLFKQYKNSEENELVTSCLVHYKIVKINAFKDGNARIGRLWQTLILMKKYPIFEYLPYENLLIKQKDTYYNHLKKEDTAENCSLFIEFMLQLIDSSLKLHLQNSILLLKEKDRLHYFLHHNSKEEFSRKDYMNVFKNISTSTASRDLKKGIEDNMFIKLGDKNKAKYITKI